MRTHQETLDRVSRLAGGLRELGVASGDRVAILSLNSDYYHEFLCAVPWADAVFVPVNIRWSLAEISYSLDEAGVEVIFVDKVYAGIVAQLKVASPGLTTVVYCDDEDTPAGMIDSRRCRLPA